MIRKHQAFVTFGCPSRPFGTLGCHCALGCPWGPLGAIGCPWVSEGPLDAIGGSWVPWQLLGALGCPCELSGAFGCRWMHLETICCIVGNIGKHWMPYVLSASIIVVVLDWNAISVCYDVLRDTWISQKLLDCVIHFTCMLPGRHCQKLERPTILSV